MAGFSTDVIGVIRTDLDAFSDVEVAVLENHGYLAADRAIKKRASHLISRTLPLQIPFPDWLGDEERVRIGLKGSAERTLLGRC
jgi:hypothetical protein